MKNEAKITFFDLETTPNTTATWSLWDNSMSYKQILRERSIICGSWASLGDDNVQAVSIKDCKYRYRRDVYDDYHVVKKLHKVLRESDIIVGHNGDKFDLRFFNGRCLVHGLPPIPPTPTIDTLKILRREFKLNSNRLDYAGQLLGIGQKNKTEMEMWTDIIDPYVPYKTKDKQIDRMVEYNIQDVILLEKLYCTIAGWHRGHPNLGVITHREDDCPHCGHDELTRCRKNYVTKTAEYEMYTCTKCFGFSRNNVPIFRISKTGLRSV